MKRIEIVYLKTKDIIPYENNPRINDGAVDAVAESIRQFGFQVPIVIDKNKVIVAGHTRLKAPEQIGMTEVPCIMADELSDEQVKAFRLADNKVGEIAVWDWSKLDIELSELSDMNIDMSVFGFDFGKIPDDAELEDGDGIIENNTNKPVAVRIVFPNSQKWRNNEKAVREFVDGLENVAIYVGAYDEDQ